MTFRNKTPFASGQGSTVYTERGGSYVVFATSDHSERRQELKTFLFGPDRDSEKLARAQAQRFQAEYAARH